MTRRLVNNLVYGITSFFFMVIVIFFKRLRTQCIKRFLVLRRFVVIFIASFDASEFKIYLATF